jgi:hypothetical protein
MQVFLESIMATLGVFLPQLVWAAIILVVGWIIAMAVSAAVRKILERTTLDDKLAENAGLEPGTGNAIETVASRAVFYVIMLIVLIMVFDALNFTVITDPLNNLLNDLLGFIPNVVAGGVLALLAWLVASLLRFIISKGLGALGLDKRLGSQAGIDVEAQQTPPLSETLGNVVYWLTFLLFLPAILAALNMTGLLAPVQNMVDTLLGYLPSVLGAGLILLIGWFVARIVRQIVTGLLVSVGTDKLGERIGLAASGSQSLTGIIGTVIYALILIPVLIASLNALQIEAISGPATSMLETLMAAIPNIFGAMIILAAAYFIGRLVAGLVTNVLTGIGFNKVLSLIGLGTGEFEEGQRTPAEIVGYLVLIGLLVFATIEAANMLGFSILALLVSEFLAFAVQVLLGLIIFGLGLYLARLARDIVMSTAGSNGRLLSQAAWLAIVIMSAAMGLRQMGIADDIVNLAFGLLLGAIALAVALAFGLGARDIAAREAENMLTNLRGSGDDTDA